MMNEGFDELGEECGMATSLFEGEIDELWEILGAKPFEDVFRNVFL